MSNRLSVAADVLVWTIHSKMYIIIIHDNSCTMDPLFPHQRELTGNIKLSAGFSPSSHEQHPSFCTCDLTLIYNLSCSFCILGFGEVSQFNYLKML